MFSLFLTNSFSLGTKKSGEHMCQLVSRFGGRFDLRDYRGQTVLHSLLSGENYTNPSLVEFLIEYGIGPSAVDNDGNTLWHAATDHMARAPEGFQDLISFLLRLDVDPQRPNNSGRNPLHCLSSLLAPRLDYRRLEVFPSCIPDIKTTAFDSILQVYVDIGYNLDSADNFGVTPLHLAYTFSEYQTTRLLQAGADPRNPTHEGLTPPHVSARCRQATFIGILLENAGERVLDVAEGSQPSTLVHKLVNIRDCHGRPALYYVCTSGRPESVVLLLDAGASVQSDTYNTSV